MNGNRKMAAMVIASVSVIALAQTTAYAQARSFKLAAGEANQTLPAFGIQSGLEIVAPADNLDGVQTNSVIGTVDARSALLMLLKGTGLEIASDRGDIIILRRTASPPVARKIAMNSVQAARRSDTASAPVAFDVAPAPTPPSAEIVVIGSQIRGAKTTGAVPVSVIGKDDLSAMGAQSANDLFRTIPQASDATFNEQFLGTALGGGSPNASRGDIASVSLRGLEQGNTLILLNGRRMVLHPTSQTSNGTPVLTYNVNAIPIGGMERVEVLRDGAAALYGSDAVAGVVNNVLASDFTGLSLDMTYGGAEGTGLREFQANGKYGSDFANGRGNISLLASYADRTALEFGDQDFTSTGNLWAYVADTPYANNNAFNTTSTSSPWGVFQSPSSFGTVRSNGTAVTSAAGMFHIQPLTNAGCQIALSATPGTCIDDGDITGAADRNLRLDAQRAYPNLSLTPSTKRFNIFSFINYDLSDDIKFFSELSYYRAKSEALASPLAQLSTSPVTIAATAYWNPFGPIGSVNRLAGLNIPDSGLNVTVRRLAITDTPLRPIDVLNQQFRLLGGLKGELGKWNWESAAVYSEASVRDTGDVVSISKLQAAINRTTADAYNPFNGGNINDPSGADTTVNNQSTIDSFIVSSTRRNKTTLAMWDAKFSTPELLSLWGPSIGIAAGLELRRETYMDDRDLLQDGSTPFVDSVTGISYSSDLLGASYRPDITGKRTVFSAYAELAVPVITAEMDIPLFQTLEFQIAGRYEKYSDVGDVARPKLAGFWDLMDGIRLRGSISGGFRAPNLEVINTPYSEGVNTRTDYIQCVADGVTNFSQCTRTQAVQQRRGGNPNLEPETSTSWSLGAVLTPPLPGGLGRLDITIDRWRIKQKGIVSITSDATEVGLDYLARLNGSTNPNVVRRDPTADDIARFAGTGLAPAGEILYVDSQYENLLPLDVQGIDFGLTYASPKTAIGRVSLNFNASKLIKYYQSPAAPVQTLMDAIAAGEINPGVTIIGGGDLVRQNGHPRWRYSGTLTWVAGPVQVGLFTQYIGSVEQTGALDASGNPWTVESQLTGNLYIQYVMKKDPLGGTTSIQLGARNVTDERPPFATNGYLATLYQPQRRYWYATIRKSF